MTSKNIHFLIKESVNVETVSRFLAHDLRASVWKILSRMFCDRPNLSTLSLASLGVTANANLVTKLHVELKESYIVTNVMKILVQNQLSNCRIQRNSTFS